jgi:SNF2 family DNA or RNA helicase
MDKGPPTAKGELPVQGEGAPDAHQRLSLERQPALMRHQEEGISFLRLNPQGALFDQPGLGKSAQALFAAEGPTTIVAPAMILDGGVWDDEIRKWGALDRLPEITQCSYSSLHKLDPRVGGTVIADESHYVKNRKAQRTKQFQKIAKHADRLILLTGTPIPNWAHEAYTLLQLLYPEKARLGHEFGSYWRWVQEWFEVGELRGKGGKVITQWHIGDLRDDRTWNDFREQNWGERTLLRKRDEVLDLPPMTEQTIRVKLKGEQARVYKGLKEDFVAWLDSGEEVVAWNDAAQWVKLWQAATHVGGKGAKLDTLRELLRDRELPTLVVAHFRESAHRAADAAGNLGKTAAVVTGDTPSAGRRQRIRLFQEGALDVLCATIDTISEGLTLTAADQVIKVERSPVPSRNEQVKRRIHRIGQDRPVSAIDLVAENTIDERILRLLRDKTDQQANALSRKTMREMT